MKNILIAGAASLALLAACNQGDDTAAQNASEAVNTTQDATAGVVGQTSAATLGANTVDGFVTSLAVGNMYEIEAARIAQTKASNADVKALASTILEDHTAAGEKLLSTASTAAPDVVLPTALDQRRKGMIDNLNAAAPDDFDRVYLDQQMAAHNETLTLLNGFSDNSDAPVLATLAQEMIPTITKHRDRAQVLVNGM
ncbi:DUF4142 domain-containing protein [Brevundimonas sp. SL130]|uniref:DUF4142 domain-containing protein n=1 Tax=Brevundimonas sp. SL130 TaxID=2995143 RepID=UPI00226CDADB|nr:DUF4142 domain-containing protein [Brevundimonas sp. SL130]WAC58854.1 DUF4142 domain-containing protein [Brevundimonas sp. SL130]